MPNIKVSVVNQSSVLTDSQIQNVVPALQTQVTRDFAPIWGIDAELSFVPKGQTPPADHWWLVVLDNTNQAGALGYHELTPAGLPIGKVFAESDIQYNLSWSVTMSHELLEMLADPDINLTSFIQTSANQGYLYAFEMCDAVEDDQFAYDINGVKVSDFVLPCYFQPSIPPTNGKYDFGGYLHQPVPTMLSGGYLSQFAINEPGHTNGWTQINAQAAPNSTCRALRVNPHSRRARRVLDKSQWKVSTVTSF